MGYAIALKITDIHFPDLAQIHLFVFCQSGPPKPTRPLTLNTEKNWYGLIVPSLSRHRVIAPSSSHHRAIAPSRYRAIAPSRYRAIAPSHYRVIVIAPSRHRHRAISPSTYKSMVRWRDSEVHGPIRIPYYTDV